MGHRLEVKEAPEVDCARVMLAIGLQQPQLCQLTSRSTSWISGAGLAVLSKKKIDLASEVLARRWKSEARKNQLFFFLGASFPTSVPGITWATAWGAGTRSKKYRMGRGSTSLHGRSAGIECVAGKCERVAGNCVPAYWREDTGGATGHWRRHAPGRKASSWRPACMAWSEAAAPAEADQAVKRMKGNPGLHKPFPCPPAARLRNFKSDLSRPPSLIMVGASASGKSEYAKSQEPHWRGTRAR